jgi:hypothetical protein
VGERPQIYLLLTPWGFIRDRADDNKDNDDNNENHKSKIGEGRLIFTRNF